MAFSFILDLWNKWNIRGFVVLSLSLQVTLVLFAPLRKRIASRPIIFLLWLAYLMADSVAAFAVGLISHNQGNSSAHVVEVDGTIQAFWASFLLLHLGGPDTIIAFSLEDNSLVQSHLLNLIFQVGAAIYVFVRIFPSDKLLVIPMILVFLAGFIKIVERTLALYLSSFPKLRESMFSYDKPRMVANSSELLEEVFVHWDGYGSFDEGGAKLAESIVVNHAYSFFQIFKIFIAGLFYTKQQREMSINYFDKVSAVDALRVISVELNFIYEELHTKALTIRHGWSYIFRIIAFTSIVVALGLFNCLKKHRLPELDVKITYILLFGGIIIDGIALFMLIFSNWTAAKIKYSTTGSSKLDSFLYKLVSATDYLRKPRCATCEVETNTDVTYEVLDTPLVFRRWSESISACNLFSEALKESPRKIRKCNQFWGIVVFKNICSFPLRMLDKIISCFLQASETIAKCRGKRSIIANAKYVSKNLFMKKLWVFIFNNVNRSFHMSDKRRIVKDLFGLKKSISKANIHNLIMGLHIATEIWYNKDKHSMSSTATLDPDLVDQKEFCKILSDYMLYILLNQPNLMSDVAMVDIAQRTWAKALRELRNLIDDGTKDVNGICEKLYNRGQNGMSPQATTILIGDTLKSPLHFGLLVARVWEDAGESKWVEMSDAWLALLKYAAINIKGETHVQVLSRGGEPLTFIWLLMAHLGFFFTPEWGLYREFWEEKSADVHDRHDFFEEGRQRT
ncbi:hypothetical protein ACJRO7_000216 [Eucalyptus globulus]|uniref:DUF4220 domain-containing protein n=1 Tax=Eucalyptus globulus TaxID=34317 RepID=A0ABD3LQ82_EUCGL